jgi:hypothetical protein
MKMSDAKLCRSPFNHGRRPTGQPCDFDTVREKQFDGGAILDVECFHFTPVICVENAPVGEYPIYIKADQAQRPGSLDDLRGGGQIAACLNNKML